jgi:hypothetical protein
MDWLALAHDVHLPMGWLALAHGSWLALTGLTGRSVSRASRATWSALRRPTACSTSTLTQALQQLSSDSHTHTHTPACKTCRYSKGAQTDPLPELEAPAAKTQADADAESSAASLAAEEATTAAAAAELAAATTAAAATVTELAKAPGSPLNWLCWVVWAH